MNSTDGRAKRTNLQQDLQDRVQRYIIDNNHRPGDALPSEAYLAALLGVSRPSLREAMRALQTIGIVESRRGSGTFVGSFRMDPFLQGMSFSIRASSDVNALHALGEILEVRTILESHLIRKVAADMTDEQLETLSALIQPMIDKAERGETFPDEDMAFHEAMYVSLGNSFIVQLVRTFWQLFAEVEGNLQTIEHELAAVVQQHQKILEALGQRDPDLAEATMVQHLNGIHDRVQNAAWADL